MRAEAVSAFRQAGRRAIVLGAQPQIARAWPALPFVSISVHSWEKSWSQYAPSALV